MSQRRCLRCPVEIEAMEVELDALPGITAHPRETHASIKSAFRSIGKTIRPTSLVLSMRVTGDEGGLVLSVGLTDAEAGVTLSASLDAADVVKIAAAGSALLLLARENQQ